MSEHVSVGVTISRFRIGSYAVSELAVGEASSLGRYGELCVEENGVWDRAFFFKVAFGEW